MRAKRLSKVERVVPNALFTQMHACARIIWHRLGDKPIHLVWLSIALVGIASCETVNYAPPVTSAMTKSKTYEREQVETAQLERGRTLFVHRCIECHTLPALWHYTPKDWVEIVNDMSHRASLKPAEREAVIAYILAVRREM